MIDNTHWKESFELFIYNDGFKLAAITEEKELGITCRLLNEESHFSEEQQLKKAKKMLDQTGTENNIGFIIMVQPPLE